MASEITWELGDGQVQSIVFDAVVRATHESSAEITEHPVEAGANISDHVRANLDEVVLEVVVSNTPIEQPKTQMEGVTSSQAGLEILDPETGLVLAKASVLVFDGEFDRVRTVHEELLNLKNAGTVVGILTPLRDYSNMIIRRVSPVREAATGDSLVAVVEAREIRIVESEVVDAPEPAETRGSGSRNRGRRNNEDTDEETEERNRSTLSAITDSIISWTADEGAPPPP